MKSITQHLKLVVLFLLVFAACTPVQETTEYHIILVADGRQRAYVHNQQIAVGQFLEQAGVVPGELDRIVPPRTTLITDGMTITVVRVEEQTECEENAIPFEQRTIPNEGLSAGEERLAQPGVNGLEERCYRTTIEDGVARQRVEISRIVVEAPQDEIVFVGADTSELEPVPIEGTLAYVSNGNIWMIRGSSATKRPLTTSNMVDGQVFSVSDDGNQILFTQRFEGEDADIYFNTLWTVMNTRAADAQPENLVLLNNILYAEWVPGRPYTFSYSTAESRDTAPGWQAFNDLWLMRLDDSQAIPINVENLVESSAGGVYGWWGTGYAWSRDGSALAWSRADGFGLVDLDTGELQPLVSFPVYATFQDWVWQPTLSWSPDNQLLIATVHGPPFGAEQPESSPIFDVMVVTTTPDQEQAFQANLMERAGIWASPQFSPFAPSEDPDYPQGYLAYLQARHPLNSVNDEYDLVLADRDGSNARVIFPGSGQPGLSGRDLGDIAWSPSGQQIALIYAGNLWIVDASSGRAQQITVDGGASLPRWAS